MGIMNDNREGKMRKYYIVCSLMFLKNDTFERWGPKTINENTIYHSNTLFLQSYKQEYANIVCCVYNNFENIRFGNNEFESGMHLQKVTFLK